MHMIMPKGNSFKNCYLFFTVFCFVNFQTIISPLILKQMNKKEKLLWQISELITANSLLKTLAGTEFLSQTLTKKLPTLWISPAKPLS